MAQTLDYIVYTCLPLFVGVTPAIISRVQLYLGKADSPNFRHRVGLLL